MRWGFRPRRRGSLHVVLAVEEEREKLLAGSGGLEAGAERLVDCAARGEILERGRAGPLRGREGAPPVDVILVS